MDILTIGHTTMDLYLRIPSGKKVNSLVEDGPKTCFYHGSKIQVDKFEMTPGGNALNVAIGTAALGLNSQIYTELGDDEYTTDIINTLKERKVDTKLCIKNKGKHNNVGTIIVHEGERTIFSYHEKQEYRYREWGTPQIIYYTSLPSGYETFQKVLINHVKQNKKTIFAFNPGTTHLKNGVLSFKDILEITDILFLNKEEAISITKEASIEKLHKQLQELGPKLTVITDGKNGASASASKKIIQIKAFIDNNPVVDKTGAGDAFSSGFLSAIHYNKPLKEALIWGAINSGAVIKKIGSIRGLLDKETMEAIVTSAMN